MPSPYSPTNVSQYVLWFSSRSITWVEQAKVKHITTCKLSILYYNARSVLPKLDEIKAVCCNCAPDIVCIVESWICGDIGDNEISLPNYSSVRLDRSRHSGGILMYINDGIPFSIVASGPAGLEIIFVSVLLSNNRGVCLGTFYRPP